MAACMLGGLLALLRCCLISKNPGQIIWCEEWRSKRTFASCVMTEDWWLMNLPSNRNSGRLIFVGPFGPTDDVALMILVVHRRTNWKRCVSQTDFCLIKLSITGGSGELNSGYPPRVFVHVIHSCNTTYLLSTIAWVRFYCNIMQTRVSYFQILFCFTTIQI